MNFKNNKTLQFFLILMILCTAYFIPRVYKLGQYVTADEPFWLESSGDFFVALYQQNWPETYQHAHPGVTALWAGTAGFLKIFPDYAEIQTYEDDFHFDRYLPLHGYNHIQILSQARLFVILGHTLFFAVIFYYSKKLFGKWPAVLIASIIAFDPFLFAHSRFLVAETFLPDTLFISLLAYLAYLREKRWKDLIISGAVFGLAMLTKTPAVLLIPTIGIAGLLAVWQSRNKPEVWGLQKWVTTSLIWGLIAFVMFYALWPAMWANPLQTLVSMFDYTVGSSEGTYLSTMFWNGHVIPDGQIGLDYPFFYPLTFLWRTTPIVMIGLALGIISLFSKQITPQQKFERGILWLAALLFTLILTLTVKKFDRYLTPIYLPLDALAGLGWLFFYQWLKPKAPLLQSKFAGVLGVGILIGFQIIPVVRTAPYYLSYYNPVLGGSNHAPEVMMIGWGEGLDEAARYINQQPNSHELNVATWYPQPFNYHFNGYSNNIPIQFGTDGVPNWLIDDEDYIVTYIHQYQRQASWALLEYLDQFEPEYVVVINGIEYARVYNGDTIRDGD